MKFGGAGIAVGAMIHGGCCAWGWGYWSTSWHSTRLFTIATFMSGTGSSSEILAPDSKWTIVGRFLDRLLTFSGAVVCDGSRTHRT
jgi:hypothetical protein